MSPSNCIHPIFDDYVITLDGNVISLKRRELVLLTPRLSVDGYIQFKVQDMWRNIHRLLCECYLPNPYNLAQVNHKDGNKINNDLSNLEWCSQQDNLYHAMRTGLHCNPEKPVIATSVKTGKSFIFISQSEAARQTGAQQSNISKCITGDKLTAVGFTWRLLYE